MPETTGEVTAGGTTGDKTKAHTCRQMNYKKELRFINDKIRELDKLAAGNLSTLFTSTKNFDKKIRECELRILEREITKDELMERLNRNIATEKSDEERINRLAYLEKKIRMEMEWLVTEYNNLSNYFSQAMETIENKLQECDKNIAEKFYALAKCIKWMEANPKSQDQQQFLLRRQQLSVEITNAQNKRRGIIQLKDKTKNQKDKWLDERLKNIQVLKNERERLDSQVPLQPNSKQRNVITRKFQEAIAINKRLKFKLEKRLFVLKLRRKSQINSWQNVIAAVDFDKSVRTICRRIKTLPAARTFAKKLLYTHAYARSDFSVELSELKKTVEDLKKRCVAAEQRCAENGSSTLEQRSSAAEKRSSVAEKRSSVAEKLSAAAKKRSSIAEKPSAATKHCDGMDRREEYSFLPKKLGCKACKQKKIPIEELLNQAFIEYS